MSPNRYFDRTSKSFKWDQGNPEERPGYAINGKLIHQRLFVDIQDPVTGMIEKSVPVVDNNNDKKERREV